MQPAIFLDRDGVIIENQEHYVRSWDDIIFFPSSLIALAKIRQSPVKIVIVTNQSAIGRGLISLSAAEQINQAIKRAIEESGGRIDAIFTCPHKPQDNCVCRKPRPGLLLQAAQELSIDLSKSIMIGDSLDDIRAGQTAGVLRAILLLTGRGRSQSLLSSARELEPFDIYPSLLEAVNALPNPFLPAEESAAY